MQNVRADMFLCSVALSVTMLVPVVASNASEAIIYKYDALGRLILADTRGTTAHGSVTAYAYDNASNRTNVDTAVVKFSGLMMPNGTLVVGQSVLSPDGSYRLTLQRNGDLCLYDQYSALIWHLSTTTGHELDMQADGNLVLYDVNNIALWSAAPYGHPGDYFAVQVDGNLVVYDNTNHPVWARFGM